MAEHFLVNPDLLAETKVVRHLHNHDPVQDGFVGMVRLELLPFGFVGVGNNHRIGIDGAVSTRCRNELFLGSGNHGVQVFHFILEYLDKLHHTPITHVERSAKVEIRIYQKMLGHSDFSAHVAPHTLEIAALFAVLTRLAPTTKCDPLTKVKIYDGEEVVLKGTTLKLDARALREEAVNEGMTGVSTRFIMKALDNALADSLEGINPINVRESLINMVKAEDISDDTKKRYLGFLQDTIHKEYLEILEKEVTRAFVYSFEEQADNLFQNYLDHAEAFVNKDKVKDANTGEELEPDESFLSSVEEQIGIVGSAAEGFRQEVMVYLWAATRRGEKVNYGSYEPLKDAIERRLLHSVRDMSRIVTKSRTRDEEQRRKYDDLIKGMIDLGYDEKSAEVVLKYAANNLWKD